LSISYLKCGDVCLLNDGSYAVIVYAGRSINAENQGDYVTILIVPIIHRDDPKSDTAITVPVEVCFKHVAMRCDLLRIISQQEITEKVDRLSVREIKWLKEGVKLVMEL